MDWQAHALRHLLRLGQTERLAHLNDDTHPYPERDSRSDTGIVGVAYASDRPQGFRKQILLPLCLLGRLLSRQLVYEHQVFEHLWVVTETVKYGSQPAGAKKTLRGSGSSTPLWFFSLLHVESLRAASYALRHEWEHAAIILSDLPNTLAWHSDASEVPPQPSFDIFIRVLQVDEAQEPEYFRNSLLPPRAPAVGA